MARSAEATASVSKGWPAEIAFLVDEGVSPKTLNRACAIARRCGTDAATALLNEGLLSEEAFYKALARRLKTPFLGGSMRLGDGLRYPQSLVIGAAPLAPGSAARVVAAPRGAAVARLIRAAARLEYRPAITTPTCLRQVVFARHGDSIATEASEALGHLRPDWSCRPGPQALDLALVGTVLALLVALVRLPSVIGFILLTLIQALMLALLTFRLAAVGTSVAQLGVRDPCSSPMRGFRPTPCSSPSTGRRRWCHASCGRWRGSTTRYYAATSPKSV